MAALGRVAPALAVEEEALAAVEAAALEGVAPLHLQAAPAVRLCAAARSLLHQLGQQARLALPLAQLLHGARSQLALAAAAHGALGRSVRAVLLAPAAMQALAMTLVLQLRRGTALQERLPLEAEGENAALVGERSMALVPVLLAAVVAIMAMVMTRG